MIVRVLPVSTLRTWTVTPGRTALDSSVIMPEMVPVVACAPASAGTISATSQTPRDAHRCARIAILPLVLPFARRRVYGFDWPVKDEVPRIAQRLPIDTRNRIIMSPVRTVGAPGMIVMIVVLAAGVAAIAYARWTRAVADADAALADGRFEQALASYAEAEARFDRSAAAKQLFASDYRRVMANQLWVLHRLERYDETIDVATRAPEDALPHFWSGVAFFEKGRAEEKPDPRLGWFNRAEEEFRRAVEATPADWD